MGSSQAVRIIMASRRDDPKARACRALAVDLVTHSNAHELLVFDRTSRGGIAEDLRGLAESAGVSSRVHVIRQSASSPVKAVWDYARQLEARWTMFLHDDDLWLGTPQIPADVAPNVSVCIPVLRMRPSSGGPTVSVDRVMTQHALFGLIRPDLFQLIAAHVCDSPNPSGGEDMMMLQFLRSVGDVVSMTGFEYIWDAYNWHPERSAETIARYMQDAGWSELSTVSTYLMAQSLDELALLGSAADAIESGTLEKAVQSAMVAFWPLSRWTVKRHLRWLPSRLRVAVIANREVRGTGARARASLRTLWQGPTPSNDFEAYALGYRRVRSLQDITSGLLPSLYEVCPTEVRPQVRFWRDRIERLAEGLSSGWHARSISDPLARYGSSSRPAALE